MKPVALVISHLNSGSTALCQIMNRNPRIEFINESITYSHPETIEHVLNLPHKCSTAAAVWLDELLYNFVFTNKVLYEWCHFIYVIRNAKSIKHNTMVNYYTYRLRRICEMARNTPNAIFLTYEDIITGKGFALIEDYLCLKEPLQLDEKLFAEKNVDVSNNVIQIGQQAYEKYLYYLRHLKLNRL